jgi:cytochrome c
MPAPLSKYTPEIVAFQAATKGQAVYCFVVDGTKGTGGMPLVGLAPTHPEYLARCRELVTLLRRSADLLERDIGGGA